MLQVNFGLFPGAKPKALSLSYDDGTESDRRLVELFNAHGVRATFHLNSQKLDFFQWHPTCHHNHHLLERISHFKGCHSGGTRPLLFYVWGHSAEFDRENNWWLMERFCQEMAHDPAIWYATNIEIADYIRDLHRLEFSADCAMVNNPCARDLWILAREEPVRIPGGALVCLA